MCQALELRYVEVKMVVASQSTTFAYVSHLDSWIIATGRCARDVLFTYQEGFLMRIRMEWTCLQRITFLAPPRRIRHPSSSEHPKMEHIKAPINRTEGQEH